MALAYITISKLLFERYILGDPIKDRGLTCVFTTTFSVLSLSLLFYKVRGFHNQSYRGHKPWAFCERGNEKAWTEWVSMKLSILLWSRMRMTKADSPKDLLPGLEVRLLNHQAIGVAW